MKRMRLRDRVALGAACHAGLEAFIQQNWNEKGRDGDTRSPFKQEG